MENADMRIQFSCSCGAPLKVADEHAGKLVLCPKCKTKCRVPSPTAAAPPPPPARPRRLAATEKPPEPEFEMFHPKGDEEDADFFRPAPEEIGSLRAAYTSLKKQTRSRSFAWR